jgi:NAD(P)H-dependent flavin oxidoreductase YrpB (nitropropane dioxygenase family)
MGMVAGPELAAAVPNAGGFGVFGTHDVSAETIPVQVGRAVRSADNTFDNPALQPDARRRQGAS